MLTQDQQCGCSDEWAYLHVGKTSDWNVIVFIVHVDVKIFHYNNFIGVNNQGGWEVRELGYKFSVGAMGSVQCHKTDWLGGFRVWVCQINDENFKLFKFQGEISRLAWKIVTI